MTKTKVLFFPSGPVTLTITTARALRDLSGWLP